MFIRGRKVYKWLLAALLPVIFLSAQGVSAQLPAVNVSVDMKNATFIEILDELSAQTGYFFTYDATLINENAETNLIVFNLPVEQALDSLFQDSTFHYSLIDKNIVISRSEPTGKKIKAESDKDLKYLKGLVIDNNSRRPLPFATVTIPGSSHGTITNQEGEFILKIPADSAKVQIVGSYIGYQNRNLSIEGNSNEEYLLEMTKQIISLQEVVIRYKNPSDLIHECLKNIQNNYLDDHSVMTAYYRENVQKDKKFMLFSEAVIEIAKDPYSSPFSFERVKVIRGRKTLDIDQKDTVLLKIKSGVKSSVQLDVIKNLPDFLSEDFNKRYDYELSDIVSLGNKLVYEISFVQKEHIKEALYQGQLYIDMKSLALLAADFRVNPEYIEREPNMFIINKSRGLKTRPVSANYHVEYRQNNGRYHLNQVRAEVKFRMRKKKHWLSSVYAIRIEMAVTNVVPGLRKKIPLEERLNPDAILSEENFQSDPDFWGNYNIIRPEADLREILEVLKSTNFSGEEVIQLY